MDRRTPVDRRTLLATAGATALASASGCLGEGGDGSHAGADDGSDIPVAANGYGYETATNDGVDVPLVPLSDAVDWHDDEDTVFVDARDRTAYERVRVAGAVLSPAPDGHDEEDPLEDVSTDARIVTYCVCPHHLATLRGASLVRDGYVNIYAIDEGLEPWVEGGHPVEGTAVAGLPPRYSIRGRTDPKHAGELAWARHDPTDQREAVPIADDGSFHLHLTFYDVDRSSMVRVSSPSAETTDTLGALADATVEL